MYNSGDASVRVCGPVGAIVTGVATPAASACSSEPNSLRGEAIAVCYFTRFQQRGTPSILVRRAGQTRDRKSTRLNSSHLGISYAVFCLKKKRRKQYYGIA